MTGGEHIRQVLAATGVYRLTGDSPVDHEVDAYAAGLHVAEEAMDLALEEFFIETAPAERLEQWEALFCRQAPTGDLAGRRKALLGRMALHRRQGTLADLELALRAAGIDGTVEETEAGLAVRVKALLGVSEQEAGRRLERLMPLHLQWELVMEEEPAG